MKAPTSETHPKVKRKEEKRKIKRNLILSPFTCNMFLSWKYAILVLATRRTVPSTVENEKRGKERVKHKPKANRRKKKKMMLCDGKRTHCP